MVPLALAVATQIAGIASQLLVVAVVAWAWGAAGQGEYGVVKSWNDFFAGILPFGLPQGFVYAVNRSIFTPQQLQQWSMHLSLAAFAIGLGAAFIGYSSGFLPHREGLLGGILLLAIAAGGSTYFALVRGIYLTVNHGIRFSLLTITPAIALAASVLVQLGGAMPRFETVFAIAAAASTAAAWLAAREFAPAEPLPLERSSFRTVLSQSLNALLQGFFLVFQPVLTFAILRLSGAGLVVLGHFNLALVAALSLNSVVAMTAPILYNHWSKTLGHGAFPALARGLLKVSALVGLACMAGIFVIAAFLPSVLGGEFKDAVVPIQLMGLLAIPLIFSRLCQPALLAVGAAGVATQVGLMRVVVLCAMLGISAALRWDMLLCASLSWVLAEWLSVLLLLILLRNAFGRSATPSIIPDGSL